MSTAKGVMGGVVLNVLLFSLSIGCVTVPSTEATGEVGDQQPLGNSDAEDSLDSEKLPPEEETENTDTVDDMGSAPDSETSVSTTGESETDTTTTEEDIPDSETDAAADENLREGDPCDPEGEGAYCLDDNIIVDLDNGQYDEDEGGLVCQPGGIGCNYPDSLFCVESSSGTSSAVFKPIYVCNDDAPDHVFCEWVEDVLVDDCSLPGDSYCGENENAYQVLQAETRYCLEDGWRTRCEPDTFHIVEDCPANGQACFNKDKETQCYDEDPCFFLEMGDVCDTGESAHCVHKDSGDYVAQPEGICGFSEMSIICFPDLEPCENGTNCVMAEDGPTCQ